MTGRPASPDREASSVVVLDLDDTLYLERDYVASGFAAVGAWAGAHLGLPNFAERAHRLFDQGRRGDVFDRALSEAGVEPTPELIARLVALYRAHRPAIRLLPDAEAFLDRPRRGRAVALLTDGPLAAQRNKIAALGLRRRAVRPLICTDVWGRACWKPSRLGFERIQARFALPAHRFLYVADNPAKDFLAPRAMGWRTVQIVRAGAVHGAQAVDAAHAADETVTSLTELTDDRLERFARLP
jgi:putative hydrolase of the HAD superfamily